MATYSPRDRSSQPPLVVPAQKSTIRRGPRSPLPLSRPPSELTGLAHGHDSVEELDHALTRNAVKNGERLGERMSARFSIDIAEPEFALGDIGLRGRDGTSMET